MLPYDIQGKWSWKRGEKVASETTPPPRRLCPRDRSALSACHVQSFAGAEQTGQRGLLSAPPQGLHWTREWVVTVREQPHTCRERVTMRRAIDTAISPKPPHSRTFRPQ